jgi:pimeloyl-ACP methyl ester carboxylesterase
MSSSKLKSSLTGIHGNISDLRDRLKPDTIIAIPALMVTATKDAVLKPGMAAKMGRHFEKLTHGEVVAGHWALWEAPDDVNRILREWLDNSQVFGSKSSL